MTKPIGSISLYAKNIAAQLDASDGTDNQISASVWNSFVKDKGGKELNILLLYH